LFKAAAIVPAAAKYFVAKNDYCSRFPQRGPERANAPDHGSPFHQGPPDVEALCVSPPAVMYVPQVANSLSFQK
jgi:hypothetical protein